MLLSGDLFLSTSLPLFLLEVRSSVLFTCIIVRIKRSFGHAFILMQEFIWDEGLVPGEYYQGETPLALPKLNLQFLTLHDYLLRNDYIRNSSESHDTLWHYKSINQNY